MLYKTEEKKARVNQLSTNQPTSKQINFLNNHLRGNSINPFFLKWEPLIIHSALIRRIDTKSKLETSKLLTVQC